MKLGYKRKGIDGGRESGDLPLTRGLTVMAGCGIRHGGCSPLRTTAGGEGRRVQALWRRCEQGRRESGAARYSLASRAAVLHRVARQPPAPPSSSPRHPLARIIMAALLSSPPARPVAASRRPRPGRGRLLAPGRRHHSRRSRGVRSPALRPHGSKRTGSKRKEQEETMHRTYLNQTTAKPGHEKTAAAADGPKETSGSRHDGYAGTARGSCGRRRWR
jgi:hypothetical protein